MKSIKIEIPQGYKDTPIFKIGDEVVIKKEISSDTHRYINPGFMKEMEELKGKVLIIEYVVPGCNWVACVFKGETLSTTSYWLYDKRWIEPYNTHKFKIGDTVIIKCKPQSTYSNVLHYLNEMNNLIGKKLTVQAYTEGGSVTVKESRFHLAEEWLTLWEDRKIAPKEGDFMRTVAGSLFIYKGLNNNDSVMDHAYIGFCMTINCGGLTPVCRICEVERYCTTDEIQTIHNALKKIGKRWNADKKCVEDIPQRKFKAGDKVRIKGGISSENTNGSGLYFNPEMDRFIGKTMTVSRYKNDGYIECNLENPWCFDEDWLELYEEKYIIGEWYFFYDSTQKYGILRKLKEINKDFSQPFRDFSGLKWRNAILWDGTKEHLNELLYNRSSKH